MLSVIEDAVSASRYMIDLIVLQINKCNVSLWRMKQDKVQIYLIRGVNRRDVYIHSVYDSQYQSMAYVLQQNKRLFSCVNRVIQIITNALEQRVCNIWVKMQCGLFLYIYTGVQIEQSQVMGSIFVIFVFPKLLCSSLAGHCQL